MTYIYKTLLLILSVLLGGVLYAITMNVLIKIGAFSSDNLDSNIGHIATEKAVYVWLITSLIGGCHVFMNDKWRYLALLPLISPSIFIIFYILSAS